MSDGELALHSVRVVVPSFREEAAKRHIVSLVRKAKS